VIESERKFSASTGVRPAQGCDGGDISLVERATRSGAVLDGCLISGGNGFRATS